MSKCFDGLEMLLFRKFQHFLSVQGTISPKVEPFALCLTEPLVRRKHCSKY